MVLGKITQPSVVQSAWQPSCMTRSEAAFVARYSFCWLYRIVIIIVIHFCGRLPHYAAIIAEKDAATKENLLQQQNL